MEQITMKAYKRWLINHPIILCVFISLGATLIWSWNVDGDSISGIDMMVTHIVGILLTLAVMKVCGISMGKGKRENFRKGMLLGCPFLILGIASALISNPLERFRGEIQADMVELLIFTLNMLLVGIGEELVYRGLILEILREHYRDDRLRDSKSVLIAAIMFGAAHLGNAMYAPFTTVLIQSLNAASAAVLFAAIYIKSRNLAAVSLIHFLVDWIALIPARCFPQADSVIGMNMSGLQAVIILLGGSLPPLLYGGYLLYKSCRRSSQS